MPHWHAALACIGCRRNRTCFIILRQPRSETAIATPLLHYRLRWYAVSTARLLLRRWQALVLLLGVLASANASVFANAATFARPILLVVSPGHGPGWRFGYLILLLACAALWAHMQRMQIKGGAFMAFAASLPVDARQRRRADLAVLVLADSPLLLMVAGALASEAARGATPAHLLLLAALVPLALAAQVGVLERRPLAAAGLVAACMLLAAAFGTRLAPVIDLLVWAGAALALRQAPWPQPRALVCLHLRAPAWPGRLLHAMAGRHTAPLQAAFSILLRERRDEALAKALGAAALCAGALGLATVFEHDRRALGAAWFVQGCIALHLSGLFRGLEMAHRASAAYTAALPLAPNWWRRFDLAAVAGFALPFLAAPALLACYEGAGPARASAGLLSYAVLLCVLRAPQLASERHAVVLSTVVAGGWMAATIACLY